MKEISYKLLAADDEYWSREKLRTMLDWRRYGIEFLEPAEDGEQALERIESQRPDILIADVNMPIIDGAALMERIDGKYPDMVSFIVSGYDDFAYVRRTMRSGAINYLLKPISKVELISAVSEALEKINEKRAQSRLFDERQERLETASSILQDRELSALLDKRAANAPRRLAVGAGLNALGRSFALIKIHDMTKAISDYRQDVYGLSYSVKARIRTLIDEKTLLFNHFTRSNEYILLTAAKRPETLEAARRCIAELSPMLDSPVTVVLCDGVYSADEMNAAYAQALTLLRERRFCPQSQIIRAGAPECPDDARAALSGEQCKRLEAFMRAGNIAAALELAINDSGLSRLYELNVSLGAAERLARQLGGLLCAQMPPDADAADTQAVEGLMEEAQKRAQTLDLSQLTDCIRALAEAVATSQTIEQSDSIKAVVRQAREYIDKSYYEQITLSGLAQSYHVDGSYLSRCFKQETGENLMLYLSKTRVSNAARLILENELALSQIAFLTGYDDYTYFSRVFKKHMGESPSEYRAKIRNGGERQ